MWIIISIIVLIVGIGMVVRAFDVVRLIGKSAWAEQKFGIGGTITAVRLLGIILMILSFFITRHPSFFGL